MDTRRLTGDPGHEERAGLADAIVGALTATPFLRVHCRVTTEVGEVLWCESWMGRDRHRTEVSRDGEGVIFAQFNDGQRAQEYVPGAAGRGGDGDDAGVVIEYSASEAGVARLIGHALACRIGVLTQSWLLPCAMVREVIRAVVCEGDEGAGERVKGRGCRVFRLPRPGGTSHVMFVDRVTLDPVRWVRVQEGEVGGERTLMTRRNEFRFEHLGSDAGWVWGLRAEQFGVGPRGASP